MTHSITINREFGSGGREVGKRLADILDIAYYDRELIDKIAEMTKIDPDHIKKYQESAATRYFPYTFNTSFTQNHLTINDKIQIAQSKIIKKLSEELDCIIVGRCSDYIIGKEAFKIFIYCSEMDQRIERCYQKVPADKSKSKQEMQKQIQKIDKERSKYYRHYTTQDWKDINNYNLCIDTAKIDIINAANLIAKIYDEIRNAK